MLNATIEEYNLDKEKTNKFMQDCKLSNKFYKSLVGELLPVMSRFGGHIAHKRVLINGKTERSVLYSKVEKALHNYFRSGKDEIN